jgi:hypothetical protein
MAFQSLVFGHIASLPWARRVTQRSPHFPRGERLARGIAPGQCTSNEAQSNSWRPARRPKSPAEIQRAYRSVRRARVGALIADRAGPKRHSSDSRP